MWSSCPRNASIRALATWIQATKPTAKEALIQGLSCRKLSTWDSGQNVYRLVPTFKFAEQKHRVSFLGFSFEQAGKQLAFSRVCKERERAGRLPGLTSIATIIWLNVTELRSLKTSCNLQRGLESLPSH